RPPYWFEVRLARDYTHSTQLLENVRQHMLRSHGFIAEITDLNPNVMFELGAVMLVEDSRPVFSLRRTGAKDEVPSDLKEKLIIPYDSLSGKDQDIAEQIRSAFERDGRIVHDDITKLIKQRKKRFFSAALLEDLTIRLSPDQVKALLE